MFRLAVVGVFLVFVGLGVLLVPLFKTTDEGVRPVFRVSGLNLIQAWQLKGRAETLTAAGEYAEADYFWRAALIKNPGNYDVAEAAMANAMAPDEQERDFLLGSLMYAQRLLSLTKTNATSVDLVAAFYEKRNMVTLAAELLAPRNDSLTPLQQRVLLKAYFKLRKLREFRDLYAILAPEAKTDPEVILYRAAQQAGWGSVEGSVAALAQLEKAAEGGLHETLATRLLLAVYGQNRQVDEYGDLLMKLREENRDFHFHHAAYWVLLHEAGRPNVARHQAEDYWGNLVRNPVASSMELAVVAKAYDQIGLPDRALDLFESFSDEYAGSAEFWTAYGLVLVNEERWEDLKLLALKIRNEAFASREIRAYSYYLEGLAEAGQGRTYNAGRAFDSVLEAEAKLTPDQAIEMAWEVYDIGYPEIASRLVETYRADLERNLKYWEITFASAYKLKRADLILEAAKRMMNLDENNVVSINNYAAALLVTRAKPEEAIMHTLSLYSRAPNTAGFVLNHGLALLQNGRYEEAERLIGRLNAEALRPELVTSLGLALFELYFRTAVPEKAERALLDVNEEHLFPEQLDWLHQAKIELGLAQPEVTPIEEENGLGAVSVDPVVPGMSPTGPPDA